MIKLTNEIIAYTAGLLDGEGCIRIESGSGGKRSINVSYWLRVSIANTDKNVILWLKDKFGGTFYTAEHKNNSNWKICYTWRISSVEACKFLKLIQPYVQIKKEQVKVAIAFQEEKSNFKNPHPGSGTPIDEVNKRQSVKLQLTELKRQTGGYYI